MIDGRRFSHLLRAVAYSFIVYLSILSVYRVLEE